MARRGHTQEETANAHVLFLVADGRRVVPDNVLMIINREIRRE